MKKKILATLKIILIFILTNSIYIVAVICFLKGLYIESFFLLILAVAYDIQDGLRKIRQAITLNNLKRLQDDIERLKKIIIR